MGCFGELKEEPGGLKDDLDEQLCIRHKTNDFIWIEQVQTWKSNCNNKQYHVSLNCLNTRNPHFDPMAVVNKLNHILSVHKIRFLKERLGR